MDEVIARSGGSLVAWLLDASGRLVDVSGDYEALTGRSLARLAADPRDWLEAVSPVLRPDLMRRLKSRLEGEGGSEPARCELTVEIVRDGVPVPVRLVATEVIAPTSDGAGSEPPRLAGIAVALPRRDEGAACAAGASEPVGMATLTAEGRVLEANEALRELAGALGTHMPRGGVVTAQELVQPEDSFQVRRAVALLAEGHEQAIALDVGLRPSGRRVRLALGAAGATATNRRPDRLIALVVERAVAADAAGQRGVTQLLRQVIDLVPHPIFAVDAAGRYVLANAAKAALHGTVVEDLEGRAVEELSEDSGEALRRLRGTARAWAERVSYRDPEVVTRDAWGAQRVMRATHVPLESIGPHGPGVLTVALDVTTDRGEAKAPRGGLDPLTRLATREHLLGLLASATTAALVDANNTFGLALVDVDGFKEVNEGLGQLAGDELLVELSSRLRKATGSAAVVARLGADEFGVLVPPGAGPMDGEGLRELGDRLRRHASFPLRLGGRAYVPSVSIGIACWEPHHGDARAVLRDAGAALHAAKRDGPGRVVVATAAMVEELGRLARLKHELRTAIDEDQLRVHLQPIVDLETLAIVGAEALVRWQHPELGMVAPGGFLPALVGSSLEVAVDRWVLEAVLREFGGWEQAGRVPGRFRLSVNVSARSLVEPDFVGHLMATLAEAQVAPGRLLVELTETSFVQEPGATRLALLALRERGVGVALDDFGTGFSSLSHLCQFPLDVLKIDRSFVSPLQAGASDPDTRRRESVVRATVGLGRELGLRVTGEGIETRDQLARLAELGCSFGQGHLFARPTPMARFGAELTSSSRWGGLDTP